jgi:tRNA(Arg) A34 adenosine deaminase TadA
MNDATYLDQAIALARQALDDDDGGPFGAVIVRDDEILGRARNRVLADHDPTAHAEVLAIRDACDRLGTHDLEGATLYASCEPCPMCLGAIYWAGISRVVFAVDRVDAAESGFRDAFFYEELCRPFEERKVEMEHRDVAAGHEVMRRWSARAGRKLY